MDLETEKEIVEWLRLANSTLMEWVLNDQKNRSLEFIVGWENNMVAPIRFKMYKKDMPKQDAVIVGFSMEGKYIAQLPVRREVFLNTFKSKQVFASLVYNYVDLIDVYSEN